MKMEELVQELMKHVDEYAIESVEQIPIDTKQNRVHSKWRVNKKWAKRYGYSTVYETKACKKISVTTDLILDFCSKYNFPIPEEMLCMM